MAFSLKTLCQFKIGWEKTDNQLIIDLLIFRLVITLWEFAWEDVEPRKVVIAGNFKQYLDWCMRTNKNPKLYRFAQVAGDIPTNEKVELYMVGNYYLSSLFNSPVINRGNIIRKIIDFE